MRRTMARMLVGGVLLAGLFGLLSGGSAQASYVCNTVSGITECHDVTFTHGAFVEVIKGSNGAVAAVAYYGTTGAAVVKGYKTTGAVIYCDYYTHRRVIVYAVNQSQFHQFDTGLKCKP